MRDRTERYAEFLARIAEGAVVNNRIGQRVGLSVAVLLALAAAAMAGGVLP